MVGEYAEMEIDAGYSDTTDWEKPSCFRPRLTEYKLKSIESETDKAWSIIVGDDVDFLKHALWFPKSICKIYGKKLFAPSWLMAKKYEEYLKKKGASKQ
jgi:hypothetical protein